MGFLEKWRIKRIYGAFERIGTDCELRGERYDIKGHVSIGDRCILHGNLLLRTHSKGRIVIENDAELADYVMIHSDGAVQVGEGTYIGAFCVLRDSRHVFYGTDMHWRRTPLIVAPISVGNHCYLGAHTYVMPGVSVADGAVIIPGSVITRDVGANEVWAGAPSAQRIGRRGEEVAPNILKRHAALLGLLGFPAPAETVSSLDSESEDG